MLQVQAAATQALADDAARDLELAMPAMKAAQDALKSLNKADINELRVFQKPPAMVKFVMEPVCLLLGAKYAAFLSTLMPSPKINVLRNIHTIF